MDLYVLNSIHFRVITTLGGNCSACWRDAGLNCPRIDAPMLLEHGMRHLPPPPGVHGASGLGLRLSNESPSARTTAIFLDSIFKYCTNNHDLGVYGLLYCTYCTGSTVLYGIVVPHIHGLRNGIGIVVPRIRKGSGTLYCTGILYWNILMEGTTGIP